MSQDRNPCTCAVHGGFFCDYSNTFGLLMLISEVCFRSDSAAYIHCESKRVDIDSCLEIIWLIDELEHLRNGLYSR
jgi:hypothetical protein